MPACKQCQTEFLITDKDQAFYRTMQVPEPLLCPQCSWQRQLAFRNETALYFRACDLCKKQTLSMYHPESTYVVYCIDCWKSDNWNPLEYGMEYDPAKSFFEQYDMLIHRVPRPALFHVNENINCQYANFVLMTKNVYLGFSIVESENVYYSRNIDYSHDVVDCLNCNYSELLYESIDCQRCYNSQYLQDCIECCDCILCYDCIDCESCFGSTNLRHKRFCWMNEQISEDEYKNRLVIWRNDEAAARVHLKRGIRRHARIWNSENSTGDFLKHCKNCTTCFYGTNAEDCSYLWRFVGVIKDSHRTAYMGLGSERVYNSIAISTHANTIICGMFSPENARCSYVVHCRSNQDCFGSSSLQNKRFCILNTQYTEEEYYKLLDKIIAQMRADDTYGEFPPAQLSCFGYNETLAHEFFPLTREEALRLCFKWQDNLPHTTGRETLQFVDVSKNIAETNERITKEILACELCKKNYKITPYELEFYKKQSIPIPHHCFECRLKTRVAMLNPVKLWMRTCMRKGCDDAFETNYAPDRQEVVYCDSCYKNTVY